MDYWTLRKTKAKNLDMICIRNPWGRLEWKGRYSDNDKEWTPELIKELAVTFADDGTFWMCLDDFLKQYNQMIVLRLLTDDIGKVWQKKIYEGEWRGKSAGGSTNHPTWRNNPQYGLVVKTPDTRMFIALNQPDNRMKWTNEYKVPIGLHLIKTADSRIPKTSLSNDEIVAKINYLPARDVSLSATLPVGEYIMMVSTFNPGLEINYWLTVYSEEPVEVTPIPEEKEVGIKSEWKGGLAGGCFNHPTWVNNPKFLVSPIYPADLPSTPVHLSILIRQPEKKPFLYLGMYSGKWEGQKIDRTLCKGSKPCLNAREISLDLWVGRNEWPKFVIPHTFEPQESTFELYTQCAYPLKIEHLDV